MRRGATIAAHWITKTSLLLFLTSAQLLQTGCGPAAESSFEVPSPTREFNALVEMVDNGGQVSPGMNVTYVYLHRATGPQLPILILLGGPPKTAPVLRWVTPTQLDIFHSNEQRVSFQAVQFDRVFVAVTAVGQGTSTR